MKPKNWVSLTLALTLFATVLQLAGLVSPLWIWLHGSGYQVGVGLYYRIGCENGHGGNCSHPNFPTKLPFGYDAASTYNVAEWEAIVWLESIASCLAVLLSIQMLVFKVGFGVWRKMSNLNLSMVITNLFLCLTLGAGIIIYFVNHGMVISRSPDTSKESFPWSTLMCFVAFFFFLVIAALTHFKCRSTRFVENAIPTSADSKLALNPSTKNQLMRRYFTPSPYREDRRQALSVHSYTDQSYLLGSASSRGMERRGIENGGLKAIDYNPDRNVPGDIDYNYVPVINTASLATGVTSGDTARSSYIHENNVPSGDLERGNYGTRVVERTLVTKTMGGVETGHVTNTRSAYREDAEDYLRRQDDQHRQWEILQAQAAERRHLQETKQVVGKETFLRENKHDGFSDIVLDNSDAVTVYYTGKEDRLGEIRETYKTVIRTDQNAHQKAYTSGGHGQQGMLTREVVTTRVQPPTPPLRQEFEKEVIENHPVNFRISAGHGADDGLPPADIKMVHVKPQSHEKVVTVPGHLSGDKHKYNGTYIYRAYTEDVY